MVVNLNSPGIQVREIDQIAVVRPNATTTAAIAGVFTWGPVFSARLITNDGELQDVFGEVSSKNIETFHSAANYLGYSDALYIVRVADEGATYASDSSDSVPFNRARLNPFDGSVPDGTTLTARYVGEYGNGVRVEVCNASDGIGEIDPFEGEFLNGGGESGIEGVDGEEVLTFTFVTVNRHLLNARLAKLFASGSGQFSSGNALRIEKVGGTIFNTTIDSVSVGPVAQDNISGEYRSVVKVNIADELEGAFDDDDAGNDNPKDTLFGMWEFFNVRDFRFPLGVSSSLNDKNPDNTINDLFHIAVLVNGVVEEVYPNVSRYVDAKDGGRSIYYKDVINGRSSYVYVGELDNDITDPENVTVVMNGITSFDLTGGLDGGVDPTDDTVLYDNEVQIPTATVLEGYEVFRDNDDLDVDIMITGYAGDEKNGSIFSDVAAICEQLKDCVAVGSLPKYLFDKPSLSDIITAIQKYSFRTSTYGILDSGYKRQESRYTRKVETIPLNAEYCWIVG